MSYIRIEEDLLVKYSIIDNRTPEGRRIHEFLLARAKVLAGRYINFDKTPITFLLSDMSEPNAFFAPVFDPRDVPRKDEYKTVRYVKNPIPTPVICLTRGLIDMVDNLDQLDFVLGHELTHWMMRGFGIELNSKGEESIADLHAVDLVYDAGGDPKQALLMSEKIGIYAKEKREEEERKDYRSRGDEEVTDVDWSSILDVHMSDSNRKAGIETSLTRLSHLIDSRTPTAIDKDVLSAHYHDPIDDFLSAHDYKRKKPLGKLKLLVGCIEHISEQTSSKENSYTSYFKGPVIRKKYQQKIVNLAEALIAEVEDERGDKRGQHKPAAINAIDLNVYLQDRAYAHIQKYGYPEPGDKNALEASAILYSYFFVLFSENTPRWDRRRNREATPPSRPQIDVDIEVARDAVKSALTIEDLKSADQEFERLIKIRNQIITIGDEGGGYARKLDNLSGLRRHRYHSSGLQMHIYDEPEVGRHAPWSNVVGIARTGPEAREYVVQFLSENRIEDFRITHNLPYIRIGKYQCYRLDENGIVCQKDVPAYEVDFAIDKDKVLAAYDYIKSYFENEGALTEKTCQEAVNIDDQDFRMTERLKDTFNEYSLAQKKAYDLISMFNALPEEGDEEEYASRGRDVLDLIPNGFRLTNPIPGFDEKGRPTVDRKLFEFDNVVFQAHFGENFREKLIVRKNAKQQKMFDASFAILKKMVDVWLDARPKHAALQEETDQGFREAWGLPKKEREEKERKLKPLEKECRFYGTKKEKAETLIFNLLYSIFEQDKHWYHLQGLTSEQKRILADFAVRDEKGAILQILDPNRYERFCDYLGILEEQTARVLSGDYQLTDSMQIVAHKHGYHPAGTRDALKSFAAENETERYRRDKSYAWYLHAFDTMRYLEDTSDIDIQSLLVCLTNIVEDDRSHSSQNPGPIICARYENYTRLVKESPLISLVSAAIADERNYEGLSFEENVKIADLMITVHRQMKKILVKRTSDYYSNKETISVEPKHQEFLDLLDGRIRDSLRKAELLALRAGNALEKVMKLYSLYCYKDEFSSSDANRSHYLKEMDKQEIRLKNLSTLSEALSFWPEDILEHVKAFVFAKNVFLDDKELENKILNSILDKIEREASGRKKSECLYILLDQNIRAAYPETRDRLFNIYAHDAANRLGKDDGAPQYQLRLAVYLKALGDQTKKEWDVGEKHARRRDMLSNSMSAADKYLLLRRLSDLIISQEQTSQMLKKACQISLNSDDMLRSYLYGIGVDYLTERMDKDPEMANRFLRFLNSKGEKTDCESISGYIEATVREEYKNNLEYLSKVLRQTDANKCKILYENFWSAPLEARAVIIARILKSTVKTEDTEQTQTLQSWERVFDVVMDNIIRPEDNSVESKYARDIMHSYIKSRSDYERELILSAMMVANRNIGTDVGNVGIALKLFLENMGPAEIKLGQAVASHPDTPDAIRRELQHLKNAADIPARWTIYDWIRAENIPEELWKNEYLGEVMGSASYYTTIALGNGQVLRILRPEAREKADKGFRVIRSMVDDLKEKETTSELSYQELTHAVQEMVIQAGKMSETETNHDLGQRQYEMAKNLCNNVELISGAEAFTLKVMDWRAKGKNWIIMDKAEGVTYNALSEETEEGRAYKKHFAKAYVLFEITNILSGCGFDHDRHGAQLSIDAVTNTAGLYDTGAMALKAPSPEEQGQLGNVIYKVLRAAMNGEDPLFIFGDATDKKIEELRRNGQDTQYLVEVKKGVLALGDFFRILDRDDVKDILTGINLTEDLSKYVYDGIVKEMSLSEKAKWTAFVAMQSARGNASLVIKREGLPGQSVVDVANIIVAPQVCQKASWLQGVFGAGDNDGVSMGVRGSGTVKWRENRVLEI